MASEVTGITPSLDQPANPRTGAKITATRMTFVLSLFCLAILGYAAIAYIHLSFHQVSDVLPVPYFIVRQRTALSALAMTIAIACIIMGFAVFMIGAKGEINFRAESSWVKGALVSGVPGPFFVLCGTIITVVVVLAKVSYEQGPTSALGAPPSVTPNRDTTPALASRTVASIGSASPVATQRSALYTTNTAIYNDLLSVVVTDQPQDAVKHLVTNEEDVSVVLINWDDQNKRPISFDGSDISNSNSRVNLSEGYLFVLDGYNADSVKALLKAASSVNANFPEADHLPFENISKIIKAALKGRVVFSHGEPAS